MQIKDTFNWNRRDFSANMECEHCGNKQVNRGCYDDSHYYQTVVPNIKCNACGESSNSKSTGELKSVMVPKYPSNLVI